MGTEDWVLKGTKLVTSRAGKSGEPLVKE